MQEVFELEIWSRPSENLNAEEGKELESKITNDLGLDAGIVLGLSFVPDKSHVDSLLIALNEKELFLEDFTSYCEKYGLPARIHDARSAASYLDYMYGRPLAWLHIPYNDFGLGLYHKILKWCDYHNYTVQDGDKLYCVVPKFEGEEPFGW